LALRVTSLAIIGKRVIEEVFEMRRWWLSALVVLLAGCATAGGNSSSYPASWLAEEQPLQADLPDLGPAPELNNDVWLNTDEPMRLENLRGKVVLLDMWTFG